MDSLNAQLQPEKNETDIDMSPNLPDFLTMDVRDCLSAMETYTSELVYFNAEPQLAMQLAMQLIHRPSAMDMNIKAMSLDFLIDPEYDVATVSEASLLVAGIEALARKLHTKLHTFGVYNGGDYLTYQFYSLINGRLAMNKIIIADPNDYYPSSAPVLPAWIAGRAQNQNIPYFAPKDYHVY